MPGKKTSFENHLFAKEPLTTLRGNTGIKARFLRTCCLRATSDSTTSPSGSKQLVAGGWEDCAAFELDPVASRKASTVDGFTTQGRGVKDADQGRIDSIYCLQPRQVGKSEQVFCSRPNSPARAAAVKAISTPQMPITAHEVMTPVLAAEPDRATCGSRPASLRPPMPTQDSAADMYSDNDSPLHAESPLLQSQIPDRQTMQHRVAVRLLGRRGVLPDGGRSSLTGCSPCSRGSADGSLPPQQQQHQQPLLSPQACDGNFIQPGLISGSGLLPTSPNSASHIVTTEYYSTLSSPVITTGACPGSGGGSGMAMETAVEVDERLCLQDEGYEPLDGGGGGYRMSAPGFPVVRNAVQGREAWGTCVNAAPGAECSATMDGAAATDDLLMRIRGSDFGGTMPVAVHVRARGLRATAGTANGDMQPYNSGGVSGGAGAPHSAVVLVGPDAADEDVIIGRTQRWTPPPAWSAIGGRDELSQEEKEWLFGQPGGIGGLPPVMALGEGGEGLVDLVRLNLPGRTVHLARKATRTCLPAFALSMAGSGPTVGAMLGFRSQEQVKYSFPFEFFDREVKAMKMVKDSGFVIRFQAATYDHEAGQGFILMEAAPYGTLEDLHAALCRCQLQPVQRQRPALLQRAFAKLKFGNAKSSAPPSLLGGSAASGKASNAGIPQSKDFPHTHSPAGGFGGESMPSLSWAPAAGSGIGFRGDAALDVGPTGRDHLNCRTNTSTLVPSREPATAEPGGDVTTFPSMQFAALGSSLMSTRALRYYGACMLQALAALHEAGYVYRDLKLSNVMVCDGGRVRLTDFGAATPCLPDQPGLFGGAAGTRAYLAPEVLPWLEHGVKKGKRSSVTGGGDSNIGPEPYTITVDSWTWGIVMVELATGWSLKELTQRVIRRVCSPRGPEPPDLPTDCGLPPALRELLLDHVLVWDPRERWPVERIRTHRFFEGLDWETLAEMEGPHAHLFTRGCLLNAPPQPLQESPDAVAVAMLEGEMMANRRGSRPTGQGSPAVVGGGVGGGIGVAVSEALEGGVAEFLSYRMSGPSSSRPSYNGGGSGGGFGAPPNPVSPGPLAPSGVLLSPVCYSNGPAVPCSRISGLISPVVSSGRACGIGSISPRRGGIRIRQSSSGNGDLIGPRATPGTRTPGPTSGQLGMTGIGGGPVSGSGRRHTLHGAMGSRRLSYGAFMGHSPATSPRTPPQAPQQAVAAE
ncbi:hypothetical protein Vretimale_11639 [Volvox reticuliferus]|uniref:Protein kinase domain-containing protein n=1 Tax=Volvox reticuliferus TaxID=1737510 RepID=A0A8J4GHW2_9CHLO|nr:hypothetical protein Vretifemale_14766 [Volvox reticuliferus]GIM07542.1 hypothetical protein Vretimale_11639 [Volvox reticuliferus]